MIPFMHPATVPIIDCYLQFHPKSGQLLWFQIQICKLRRMRGSQFTLARDNAVAAICFELSPAASVWSTWDPCSMYLSGSVIALHCKQPHKTQSYSHNTINEIIPKSDINKLPKSHEMNLWLKLVESHKYIKNGTFSTHTRSYL